MIILFDLGSHRLEEIDLLAVCSTLTITIITVHINMT